MNTLQRLRQHGIQPTPQRLAVAACVLHSERHPSADEVFEQVRETCPTVSRATVYNTLNLLVERGLVRQYVLREGATVFDPHVDAHHHFIDEATGEITDIPWDAIQVQGLERLGEVEVRDYQVILRGRRR